MKKNKINTSGHKQCCYKNCHNRGDKISWFKFPLHDKERLEKWIANTGNESLKSSEKLDKALVCAAHFLDNHISEGKYKCQLLGPVVPIPYDENREEPSQEMLQELDKLASNYLQVYMQWRSTPKYNDEPRAPLRRLASRLGLTLEETERRVDLMKKKYDDLVKTNQVSAQSWSRRLKRSDTYFLPCQLRQDILLDASLPGKYDGPFTALSDRARLPARALLQVWRRTRALARARVEELVRCGDYYTILGKAAPTATDWAEADLVLLHGDQVLVPTENYYYNELLKPLVILFHLVQRWAIEQRQDLEERLSSWLALHREYESSKMQMSVVGLQRRWSEMKGHASLVALNKWRFGELVPALLQAVAGKYPGARGDWTGDVRKGVVVKSQEHYKSMFGRPPLEVAPVQGFSDDDDDDAMIDDNQTNKEQIDEDMAQPVKDELLELNPDEDISLAVTFEHSDDEEFPTVNDEIREQITKTIDIKSLTEKDKVSIEDIVKETLDNLKQESGTINPLVKSDKVSIEDIVKETLDNLKQESGTINPLVKSDKDAIEDILKETLDNLKQGSDTINPLVKSELNEVLKSNFENNDLVIRRIDPKLTMIPKVVLQKLDKQTMFKSNSKVLSADKVITSLLKKRSASQLDSPPEEFTEIYTNVFETNQNNAKQYQRETKKPRSASEERSPSPKLLIDLPQPSNVLVPKKDSDSDILLEEAPSSELTNTLKTEPDVDVSGNQCGPSEGETTNIVTPATSPTHPGLLVLGYQYNNSIPTNEILAHLLKRPPVPFTCKTKPPPLVYINTKKITAEPTKKIADKITFETEYYLPQDIDVTLQSVQTETNLKKEVPLTDDAQGMPNVPQCHADVEISTGSTMLEALQNQNPIVNKVDGNVPKATKLDKTSPNTGQKQRLDNSLSTNDEPSTSNVGQGAGQTSKWDKVVLNHEMTSVFIPPVLDCINHMQPTDPTTVYHDKVTPSPLSSPNVVGQQLHLNNTYSSTLNETSCLQSLLIKPSTSHIGQSKQILPPNKKSKVGPKPTITNAPKKIRRPIFKNPIIAPTSSTNTTKAQPTKSYDEPSTSNVAQTMSNVGASSSNDDQFLLIVGQENSEFEEHVGQVCVGPSSPPRPVSLPRGSGLPADRPLAQVAPMQTNDAKLQETGFAAKILSKYMKSSAPMFVRNVYCCGARRHRSLMDARARMGRPALYHSPHHAKGEDCHCCCRKIMRGAEKILSTQQEEVSSMFTSLLYAGVKKKRQLAVSGSSDSDDLYIQEDFESPEEPKKTVPEKKKKRRKKIPQDESRRKAPKSRAQKLLGIQTRGVKPKATTFSPLQARDKDFEEWNRQKNLVAVKYGIQKPKPRIYGWNIVDLTTEKTNNSGNVSANVSTSESPNVSANVSTNISANETANASALVVANVSTNVSANVSANETANGVSDTMLAKVLANVSANMSANMSANISSNMSANVSANSSDNVPASVSGNIKPIIVKRGVLTIPFELTKGSAGYVFKGAVHSNIASNSVAKGNVMVDDVICIDDD